MNGKAYRWIYEHTKRSHIRIMTAAVLNTIVSTVLVYFAFAMRNVIDAAVTGNPSSLRKNCIQIVVLTVLLYVCHIIERLQQEKITVEVSWNLRTYLLNLLMKKQYPEVQKKHSGEWINLMFSDIRVLSEGVSSIIPGIAGMISRLLFAFASLIILEPVLAGVYLLAGTVILIGISLLRGKMKVMHTEVQKKEDRMHANFQEIIENLMIIKTFGAEEYVNNKIDNVQTVYSEVRLQRRRYRLLAVNLYSMLFRIGYLLALTYGAYQLFNGSISYGTLTAVLHIVSQIQGPINSLSGTLPKIYETAASAERIMETEKLEDEIISNPVDQFDGLSIDHVSFSYDRERVIDDISFDVKPNDIISLTGISGSGKSTLFLLILGLYLPENGEIRVYSGNDVMNAGSDTRKLFAYVPQGNALLSGTIWENVVFNHEFDNDRYIYALKTADAWDFVNELPEKDQTMIGERGKGLSEGQLQRVAIARAVYSNAPVILLDESTSALDVETEAKVLENIHMMKNKTVLIVTHRKAALNICDRHLNLQNHTITEKTADNLNS